MVTPQGEELEPLLGRFSILGHAPHRVDVGQMACFDVPSLDVVAGIGGHGKTQFALQSQ
jgi:hypothetical protein